MKRDIKEQIIDSARKIFARFGYKKTTLDEIANSIHKGKSSIYHYFNSKEEIFKEVVKKEYTFFMKDINEALSKQDSPKDKLRVYVLTRLEVLSNLSNIYAALKNDYFECLGLIEEIRTKYIQEEINIFKKILQEGNDKEIFFIEDVNLTARSMITALNGLEYSWALEENKDDLSKDVNKLLDILFYGILKR